MIGADTTFLVQLELREAPRHDAARAVLKREVLDAGEPLGLTPAVVAEFIHVVTDPKRFERPLTMGEAAQRASYWWNAGETQHLYPTAESMSLFFQWLGEHRLGRKRLLDTQLAATLWAAGGRKIISSNAGDFEVFGLEVICP